MRLEELLAGVRGTDPGVPTGARGFRGRARGSRDLATVPLLMVPVTPSTAAFDLLRAINNARADVPMWTLDALWSPTAQWASMKACIAQHNYGAAYDSQPWDAPGIVAAGGCKNWAGTSEPPSCDWGFWRLPQCSLEAASRYSFQFSRYLWAQTRMRDLLARRPVASGASYTTAAAAADWAWQAAQLISVLLWSTNVRFDGGYGAARQVDADLVTAGLLLDRTQRVWDPRRNWTGHERDETLRAGTHYRDPLPQLPPPDSGAWQSVGVVWELLPTVFNYLGNDPVAAIDQNGFSPSFLRTWGDPLLRFGSSDTAPMVTAPSAAMDAARAAADASGAAEWQRDQVVFRRWFELNWVGGAPVWVKTLPIVYKAAPPQRRGSTITPADWTRSARTLWTTSPQWIVGDLAAQLAHYSDPTRTFFDWMNTALRTYDINTPSSTSSVGQSFTAAKHDLLQAASAAATQASALAAMPGASSGDSTTGALIVQTGISLVATIASLVLPVVGLFFTAFSALTDFLTHLTTGLIAEGPKPCPAFPFIRVMSPSSGECVISADDVQTSLLGIDSHASWPVSIGGQTRTFVIDGKTVPVTFTVGDTTADGVARRINAAAALVPGLAGVVASVRAGQVHVEGQDLSQGPVRATGGNAAALGFPGPIDPPPVFTSHPTPIPTLPTTPSSSGSALPWLAVGAVALKFLLG